MEEITWTFFVLDFDDTFDNEVPDSLGCATQIQQNVVLLLGPIDG